MKDLFPRVLSRSFEISEGQACFGGCKGHFKEEYEGDGCSCHTMRFPPCSYCTSSTLDCDKCGLEADTAEAVAAVALGQFQATPSDAGVERCRETAVSRPVEPIHQGTGISHEGLYQAIRNYHGFKQGLRAFEQDIVPGSEGSQ